MKIDPILVAAFRGLTPEQVGNFRWHHKRGTRILCSYSWIDGKGGVNPRVEAVRQFIAAAGIPEKL